MENQIKEFIAAALYDAGMVPVAELSDEVAIKALGLDDLAIIEIIVIIGDQFDIKITDAEIDRMMEPDYTVGDLVRLTEGKVWET